MMKSKWQLPINEGGEYIDNLVVKLEKGRINEREFISAIKNSEEKYDISKETINMIFEYLEERTMFNMDNFNKLWDEIYFA